MASENEQVRLSAAAGILNPDREIDVSKKVLAAARSVVAGSWRHDIKDPGIQHRIGKILSADGELAFKWIGHQVRKPDSYLLFSDDRILAASISALSNEQRQQLFNHLIDNHSSRILARMLVEYDLELFDILLKSGAPSSVRLAPLANAEGKLWRDMVLMAIDSKLDEREIASCSHPDHFSWSGSESSMWQHHINRFEMFSDDPDAGIRRIVRHLTEWFQPRLDDAKKRERELDIYGLHR